MTDTSYRRYPRNSPQAAGRILITAVLANGDLKAVEWQRLAETSAFDRLGLQGLQWHAVMGELCDDLMGSARTGGHGRIDGSTLAAWLDEIDDPGLQALLIDLCAQVIEADGEVHPAESLVLRAALEQWVLPMQEQERLEPLVYGLDFQVVPRRRAAASG
jgi:uncharacterized tellurite resistance protein B-like protein